MTSRKQALLIALAAGSAVLCAAGLAAAGGKKADDKPKTGLAALLEQIPQTRKDSKFHGPPRKVADAMFAEILKGGQANIVALVNMVREPQDEALDFRPRYALHGLAQYVGAKGRDDEKQTYVSGLLAALKTKRPKSVQGFVIRQLQVAPDKQAIEPVAAFLLDAELSAYAAQTLTAIGGEEAAAALRNALPKAEGPERRALIRALGDVRDAESIDAITAALADKDRDVRVTAAFALAEIGQASAADALFKAAETDALHERSRMTEACLLLGQRLVQDGRHADAERLYLRLGKARQGPADRHVRCAALRGLAEVPTDRAMQTIAASLASEDARIRAAAVVAAAAIPGKKATQLWLAELKDPEAEKRALVLAILARRGDASALPAVLERLKDKEQKVRLSAVAAAGQIGGTDAADALIALLDDKDGRVRGAARKALESMQDKQATARVAAAVEAASAQAKRELLGVLVARAASGHLNVALAAADDKDESVRSAAIKAVGSLGSDQQAPKLLARLLAAKDGGIRRAAEEALISVGRKSARRDAIARDIVAAVDKAPPATRAALVRVLGRLAAPAGLDALRKAARDADAAVQDEAVRALADWPDAATADDLLAIAKSAGKESHRVMALRGYIGKIHGRGSPDAAEAKLEMCRRALAAAKRTDEKKRVLSALGGIRTRASLEMVMPHLADAALAEEAGAAAVRIAGRLRGDDAAAAREAVEKVLARCKNERTRRDAQRTLDRLKKTK